ncbi:MAG: UDP-N-acetylmuramoylalanyl-D-glutamyl-2,6-diaminopimelate--D-alanyl-D-alanine ligase [Pseudomonadota bacterium]
MLWAVDDMIAAIGARPIGNMPEGVDGISIDTRTLQPGDAFFAIKGDRFDGHDFMTFAMKAGATLAVVSEDKLVALGSVHIPLLVVRDVMEAMRMLARAARKRSLANIVAITGSVGKTTTKEMMRTVLGASGLVHASTASFNNHWGVPLSLARMPINAEFAVFEIGMNHPDEIRPLVKLVSPHIAMVTNIAPAHLGNFKSLAAIARAKAEIFEGVTKKGDAIINRDSRYFGQLSKAATAAGVKKIYSFGKRSKSDFRLLSLKTNRYGSNVHASIGGTDVHFELKAPGEHLVYNALAVLGAAKLAGAELDKGIEALANVMPGEGRGKQHKIEFRDGEITVIDESYNANPVSVKAALGVLASVKPKGKGRRVAILGDMLELGRNSAKLHRELAETIMECKTDVVLLAGPEIEPLADELVRPFFGGHYENAEELLKALKRKLLPGDVILVKASNGMKFATIVDGLRELQPAAAVQ